MLAAPRTCTPSIRCHALHAGGERRALARKCRGVPRYVLRLHCINSGGVCVSGVGGVPLLTPHGVADRRGPDCGDQQTPAVETGTSCTWASSGDPLDPWDLPSLHREDRRRRNCRLPFEQRACSLASCGGDDLLFRRVPHRKRASTGARRWTVTGLSAAMARGCRGVRFWLSRDACRLRPPCIPYVSDASAAISDWDLR